MEIDMIIVGAICLFVILFVFVSSHKNDINNEIDSANEEIRFTNDELKSVQNELENTKNKNYALTQELDELKKIKIETEQSNLLLIRENQEYREKLSDLESQVVKLKQELEKYESKPSSLAVATKIKLEPELSGKIAISEFYLESNDKVTFSNDIIQIKTRLQDILDVSKLLEVIEESNYKHKDVYAKKINQYQRDLRCNLLDCVDKFADDEEEISYNITSKFLKIIKGSLMKLPRSIYYSNLEDVSFNRKFLHSLNNYLARCGFSTINIAPGTICDDDALEVMKALFMETDDSSKDRLIENIEQLPYVMYYYDDYDEVQKIVLEGTMLVLQYKN